MKSSNIGGQAVMEGIMMRHKDKYSIAVRRPDNEIELKVEDYKCVFGNAKFLKYPLIRGVVSFVDSLVVGTKCLMYSAEIAGGIFAILQGWLYTDLLWAGAFGCLMAALNFRDSKNDGG